jgi:nucleotide-binding universal stress UspA family protein
MVVPEGTISPIRRIMVPLDGSQRAECALTIAEKMAQVEDRELLIVHVVPQPELLQQSNQNLELVNLANQMTFHGNKEGSNYLKQLSSRIRCKTETYLATHRNVTAALHEICQEKAVDLVIMSAHGYAGDPRWSYGSTTGNFLIYGNLPILVVQDIQSTRIPAVHPASQPRTSYASAS